MPSLCENNFYLKWASVSANTVLAHTMAANTVLANTVLANAVLAHTVLANTVQSAPLGAALEKPETPKCNGGSKFTVKISPNRACTITQKKKSEFVCKIQSVKSEMESIAPLQLQSLEAVCDLLWTGNAQPLRKYFLFEMRFGVQVCRPQSKMGVHFPP